MTLELLALLFASLLCLFLSFLFSGSEMAFISSSRPELWIAFDRHPLRKWVKTQVVYPSRFLLTVLIGNNIVLVGFSLLWAEILAPWLQDFTEWETLIIETISATVIVVLLSEYLPKQLGYIYSWQWLRWASYILYPFSLLTQPIVWILNVPRRKTRQTLKIFSFSEIEAMIFRMFTRTQSKSTWWHLLVQRFFRLIKKRVRDCLTPRTDLVAVPYDATPDQIRETFIQSRKARILVYRDNIDHVVGYIHLFSMLKEFSSVSGVLMQIPVVTESTPLLKALEKLLEERRGIAWVVDEYGATAGVITLKDIFRELTGYSDEEDRAPDVRVLSDGTIIAGARERIDVLNQEFDLAIPEREEYETLAGYILYKTGMIPPPGTTLTLDGYEIEILEATDTRIQRVKIKKA